MPTVIPAPHPETGRLREAIRGCLPLARPWAGDIIRATGFGYANRHDLPRGQGSKINGGRWNPRGWATLYGGLDMTTALEEVLAYYRHQGLPEIEATPLAWIGFHVRAQAVLDLRDPAVRRKVGVPLRQIKEEPGRAIQNQGREALTQAIGRLARQAGFEGLLVPSARAAGGTNLVLFLEQLRPASVLDLHQGDQLPARRRRARKP